MIGVDTNIWVRYFTRDDPKQSPMAKRFLDASCSAETPAWMSVIVLCELTWALRKSYRYSRAEIGGVIRKLLDSPEIVVEKSNAVEEALEAYSGTNVGFSDCLIGRLNIHNSVAKTFTFDARAARLDGFELLQIETIPEK